MIILFYVSFLTEYLFELRNLKISTDMIISDGIGILYKRISEETSLVNLKW